MTLRIVTEADGATDPEELGYPLGEALVAMRRLTNVAFASIQDDEPMLPQSAWAAANAATEMLERYDEKRKGLR
jgi:hypothetical protein